MSALIEDMLAGRSVVYADFLGYDEAAHHSGIERAQQRGARLLELTSNKARQAAHRFYERIGFANTHEGFKKKIWES